MAVYRAWGKGASMSGCSTEREIRGAHYTKMAIRTINGM